MRLDLTHNKIVADTMTERFAECVRTRLVPMIEARLGEAFEIQMYEDYISDNLSYEGEWYYPMTVLTAEGALTVWVSWATDGDSFEGGVPYSYVGEGAIDFKLHERAPLDFEERLRGRARYCEAGLIPVRVESVAGSVFLSGKYSQTFIDELARQITPAIEAAMGVSGLSDSSLSLSLVFAPETYMEHTSENVTYRRLLLADKTSAPRDLWVKWTRRDGGAGYSVSAHVSGDEIAFELGEGVPQKIREKEYRFMLRVGPAKYQAAMGRKNITEWRELVKRAVRRGELTKAEVISREPVPAMSAAAAPTAVSLPDAVSAENEVTLAPVSDSPVAAGLFEVAEEVVADEPTAEEDDFAAEMRRACEAALGITESRTEEAVEEIPDDDEITRLALAALGLGAAQTVQEEVEEEIAEADEEIIEAEEELAELPDEEYIEEEIEEIEETEEVDEVEEIEEAEEAEEAPATEAEEADPLYEEEPVVPSAIDEDKIRAEIEARVRLEYERRERERIEAEAARLRREQEELRRENERLLAEVRREREEWSRREEARLAEAERLRAQIEQQLRAEEREKERLAEAARFAVEEKQRLAEEKLRAEERERENQLRMAKIEAERRLEAERLAEAERLRREAEARAERERSEASYNKYTYTSKTVRLLFRRSVDPNVTARIHEIIKATLEYYGKERVHLRIKASVPDTRTVCLEFVQIPMEEMELLSNIIKVLGNSGLGIAKAIVE